MYTEMFDPEYLAKASLDHVNGVIAEHGLRILKNILDENGFAQSTHLKNYIISSEQFDGMIMYSIEIEPEGLTSKSAKLMNMKDEAVKANFQDVTRSIDGKKGKKNFIKKRMMTPDGRVFRVAGSHDARNRAKSVFTETKSALTSSTHRRRKSPVKNAEDRELEHLYAAMCPRRMEVKGDKLDISLRKEVLETPMKVIIPKNDYTGIVKMFIDKLMDTIEVQFASAVNKVIQG